MANKQTNKEAPSKTANSFQTQTHFLLFRYYSNIEVNKK